MEKSFRLLPQPRLICWLDEAFPIETGQLIVLEGGNPQELFFSAKRLQAALLKNTGSQWQIFAGKLVPTKEVGLTLRLISRWDGSPQSYRLQIRQEFILLEAGTPAGIFYGVCTLIQLLSQLEQKQLPGVIIEDLPDYPVRGVLIDVSRDKVPHLKTLFQLVDLLASWKINQLQLYTEHTFAYRNHPDVWQEVSPITGEDILALDQYCRERFIELVPNQATFGHMRRWLIYPRYQELAESLGTLKFPWGSETGPFSLAPTHPGSFQLVQSLFDELLPHFSSKTVNINCDETFDLGQGQSAKVCAEIGSGQVYLDYLLKLQADLKRRGYKMQFWGDMILQSPELIEKIPPDSTALVWGYEADHPFAEQAEPFQRAGLPFYVCPGTSSWNSLAGRTKNALENLLNAAESGLKQAACGYLITDWGDAGHWQALPVSYVGFAAGAAYSWGVAQNRDIEIPQAVSLFAFQDKTFTTGQLFYDLGNIYRKFTYQPANATVLFGVMLKTLPEIRAYHQIPSNAYQQCLNHVEQVSERIDSVNPACEDAEWVKRELLQTAHLLRHACWRGLFAWEADLQKKEKMRESLLLDMAQILAEYRSIWLARNRPGGLFDSQKRFEDLIDEYQPQ